MDDPTVHPCVRRVGNAKEELPGATANLTISDRIGIGHHPGRHEACVKRGVRVLKGTRISCCFPHLPIALSTIRGRQRILLPIAIGAP